MKQHQITNQKTFHTQMNLHTLAIQFFIFGTGLLIGVTLTLCLKDSLFYFPLNQFFVQSPPLPSWPNPLLHQSQKENITTVRPNTHLHQSQKENTTTVKTNTLLHQSQKENTTTLRSNPLLHQSQKKNTTTVRPNTLLHQSQKENTTTVKTTLRSNPLLHQSQKENTTTIVPNPLVHNVEKENITTNTSPVETLEKENISTNTSPMETYEIMHKMQDQELMAKALITSLIEDKKPLNRVPKVAFMFLSKGNLPLAPLWEKFFKGYQGFYSIYVHPLPSFNGSMPKESVFHGRRIPSKVVEWGKFNMVEAERRLLANALLDLSNERFVLLSESCIPLFNFSTIYSYLINSTTSFIESYDLPGPVGRGRFNGRMKPRLTLDQWRKGSQWIEMNRALAIEVISDRKYFPLFKKFCKPSCYSDEHYLPTFTTLWFGEQIANRSLTWVDWSKGGPHPTKFGRLEVTPPLLKGMRNESTCVYNGEKTNVCFLFARKFLPNTLDRLLRFAPSIMQFD